MTADPASVSSAFLASIQPVVLVGGKSRRFGRDKLLEPWHGKCLVEHPIDALRRVFGARVKVVGTCDPRIPGLADGTLPDSHEGAGPIGGIVAALDAWRGPVFVLAGDMPSVSHLDILAIAAEAERRTDVAAVLGFIGRVHPCFGVYLDAARPLLCARLASRAHRLLDALPSHLVFPVAVRHESAVNVNTPE
ncbi:MAG: molybdenum cofactor guanylyltransferase [Phycisphaerales bacterium]|nr:molybdenum cofactor guanylyltransferase [Phycisphaerales bacterium]